MKRSFQFALMIFVMLFLSTNLLAEDNLIKVAGTVVDKGGKAVNGAFVYLYSSTSRGQMGPSDYMSDPSDEKGGFTLKAAAGEYYIIARKRQDNSNVGVLDTGDFSSASGDKINVKEGLSDSVKITLEEIVEPMFFKKTGTEITDIGIKGFIFDKNKKPVPGAFAIAYKDPKMKTLPDYASVPAQADGSYTLFLPEAGKYYIGARVNTKRPPEAGEPYGTYNKNKDHSIEATDGSFIEDVNITLAPFSGTVETDFKGFK